jgi:Cof subfamily protein (haloacid dehalogenase superfamily)
MAYNLIALDIDGTIRSLDRPISKRTLAAVREVMRKGATVTLVTGRMFSSALLSAGELNITSPLVSFQGAHIADPDTREVLMHRPLTAAMARMALSALNDWESEVLVYHDDQVYVNMMTPWLESYAERNRGLVRVVDDLSKLTPQGPTRLAAVGDVHKVADLTDRLVDSLGSRLYIARSLPHLCEILHPRAGKHRALAWLARYLRVPQSQTIAFGNGKEDAEMLRWAGLGVAVEGAGPEALKWADRVAPCMEDDGVAQVLEELIAEHQVGA